MGEDVICTMDALVCSDGSSVGRVAPDCEFSPCPEGHEPIDYSEVETPPVVPPTQVLPIFYDYNATKPWYSQETPLQVGNMRVEVWMVAAAVVAGFLLFKAGGSQ